MTRRHLLYLFGFLLLLVVAPVAYQIDRTAQSLPPQEGQFTVPGLQNPVEVELDQYGIPTIRASHREDAYQALGYLHARDRLFQMDLLRRKMAGRLAEILGEKAVASDRQQRLYGFDRVARAAVEQLPPSEQAVLLAYTAGVNTAIQQAREFPPEFRFLRVRPEPWTPADSLMVGASMFQMLSDSESEERMLTVMQTCLKPDLIDFLTPDGDDYSANLVGGTASRRPPKPLPVQSLLRVLQAHQPAANAPAARVVADDTALGSNSWAIAGSKTADGRAIIANDMHLPLTVPIIWYRAKLQYGERLLAGLSLPGLPLIVAGGNGHVAWGYTNLNADVEDLILLQINPQNPNQYRTPQGWEDFSVHTESLTVRDAAPVPLERRETRWGPVLDRPLLGHPVAVRWTALDPAAINLDLLEMDGVTSVNTAIQVMKRFGAPPQNVVLADQDGHIAWTLTGKIPDRRGMDGSISVDWAHPDHGWSGYARPERLPHVVDPTAGYLVTANQRQIGSDFPLVVGHNFAHAYRAYRIGQRLAEKPVLDEQAMLDIQLDTRSEFYEFYRNLALEVLREAAAERVPEASRWIEALRAWDGQMRPDSRGLPLLVAWRSALAQRLFSPLVKHCELKDAGFGYQWREMETPLRRLIQTGNADLARAYGVNSWHDLLLDTLISTARDVQQRFSDQPIDQLTWASVNTVTLQHPFSRQLPWVGLLLDMPPTPGACNANCIKVLHERNGASERLVLSPNHPESAILEMPAGQSGHPFSPHFSDQQTNWDAGIFQAFEPGPAKHIVRLVP